MNRYNCFVDRNCDSQFDDHSCKRHRPKEHGYTDIYKQSLINITEMQKLMGKKDFEEIIGGLLIKPQGKPTLVPETDKRPALNTAKDDFKED